MDEGRYARFKRLMEYYTADPSFRKEIKEDPQSVVTAGGLSQEDGHAVLSALEDIIFHGGQALDHVYTLEWRRRIAAQTAFAVSALDAPRYRDKDVGAYVQSALTRVKMESALLARQTQIRYVPLAYEASDGCKVQCSFCGLAAKPWTEDFDYEKHRSLWQGILGVARDVLGDVADQAPLYFATEPLDHPRYEDMLKDVEALGGLLPQTTTAVPERDIGRTKALMAYLGKERLEKQARLRFSVRTLGQFRRIMEAFSPEELIGIELLMNNPESIQRISASGRAREDSRYAKRPAAAYSISCLCGVRVSLCEKRMTFMEPEKPDAQSPLGIRVRRSTSFTDGDDFAAALRGLYASCANPLPAETQALTINRHVRIMREAEQIIFAGEAVGYRIPSNRYTERMTELFAWAAEGISARDMAEALALGQDAADEFFAMIGDLYEKGYLVVA